MRKEVTDCGGKETHIGGGLDVIVRSRRVPQGALNGGEIYQSSSGNAA